MSFFHSFKLIRLFSRKLPKDPVPKKNPSKPSSSSYSSTQPSQDPLSLEFQKFVQSQANKQEPLPSPLNEKILSSKNLSSLAKALATGQVIDLGELDDGLIKELEDVEKDIEDDGGKEIQDMIDKMLKEAESEEGKEKNE